MYSNEATTTPVGTTPNNTKVQTASTDSLANNNNTNIFTESLAQLIISKLKENTNEIPTQESNATNDNNNNAKQGKESNEINILKFFNGLQTQFGKKLTSSTNLINLETSVDVDKSTLVLNGKSKGFLRSKPVERGRPICDFRTLYGTVGNLKFLSTWSC